MTNWEGLAQSSIDKVDQLNSTEIGNLRQQITDLGQYYNIPGVSPRYPQMALGRDSDFVTASRVGGNITNLTLNGEDIYYNGAEPYSVPLLDENGKLTLYSPDFYRWVGHHVVPAANKWPGFNPSVHTRLEDMAGQNLPTNYDTGHHGVSQCRIGELMRDGDALVYNVTHRPDRANLFELNEQMNMSFDGEWYMEEINLHNPNDHDVPVSLLRHPYFMVPNTSLEDAVIYKVKADGQWEKLYELGEYKKRQLENTADPTKKDGEDRFDLPRFENGERVAFDRGDGVIVELAFEGDYPEGSGLQIFSNGYDNEKLLNDFDAKFEIHKTRLKAARDFMDKLGMDTSWYSEESLEEERALHRDMLQNFSAVCIEDVTAVGNIYAEETSPKKGRKPSEPQGIDTAIIMPQGDIKRFRRYTRAYRKAA